MASTKKHNHNTKYLSGNKRQTAKAPLSFTQKLIIAVIILAIIVTIIGVIISFFLQPEHLTKSRIESLATDYYENYLYENLINSENYSGDIEATMSKHAEIGFTPITLRQLILHDQEKTASIADSLRANCDVERTTIKYYPVSPYSRTDYRVDYNYICNF